MPSRRRAVQTLTTEAVALLLQAMRGLSQRVQQMELTMQQFDALRDDVARQKSVVTSVVVLIQGLNTKLTQLAAAAGDGPTADQIIALQNDLDQAMQPLADAVAAGTGATGDQAPGQTVPA